MQTNNVYVVDRNVTMQNNSIVRQDVKCIIISNSNDMTSNKVNDTRMCLLLTPT